MLRTERHRNRQTRVSPPAEPWGSWGELNMKSMEIQTGAPSAPDAAQGDVALLASSTLSREKAVEILASPCTMADFFRSSLSRLFPQGAVLEECRPSVLRDRLGSRQVISYRLIFTGQGGRRSEPVVLVLKRYANKAEGKKSYAIMKMLWENGFDRRSGLMVPEPLCYLEEMGLLVQERAHGMQLRRNLNLSGPVALERMKAVARWLAKLHRLDVNQDRIALHQDEESSLRAFVSQVGSREHRLLPKLEELTSVVLMKLSSFQHAVMTPVHGDFQCENIFVDNDRVSVVDFDRFCRSDPARDLGYLIAQMRAMAYLAGGAHCSVYPELKAFWEEYLRAASDQAKETLSARTSLFAARKCLQNIHYMSYVLQGQGLKIVSLLLDDAERFCKAERVEEVMAIPIASGYRGPGS